MNQAKVFRYIQWLLPLSGFLLVLFIRWGKGPLYTTDSLDYLAAAEGLSHGGVMRMHEGSPYTGHPPLFPVVLFLWLLIPIDKQLLLVLFNALSFAGILAVTARLLQKWYPGEGWICLLALLWLMFSPAFFSCFVFLWSESFFLLMLSLYFLSAGSKKYVSLKSGICIGLLSLCRYPGVAFLVPALFQILENEKFNPVKWVKKSALCVSIPLFLLCILVAWNYWTQGVYTGEVNAPVVTVWGAVADVLTGLSIIVIPARILPVPVMTGIGIVIVGLLVALFLRKGQITHVRFTILGIITSLLLLVVLYSRIFLYRYEIETRFQVPVIWLMSLVFPAFIIWAAKYRKWAIGLLCLLGLVNALRLVNNLFLWM